MPRTRKPIKVKEPIRLRTKELANGSKSLYLDIISSNAEKDITESAGANIAQSAENIDCTASSNYNISSTDFTATGSSSATVSGTTKATIDSSGTTAVAGTIVKLN